MSIFTTFYYLFKSDTSDLKKGTAEAKKSTDDLNTSVTKTSEATAKLGKSFLGMAQSFTGMIAAALSAGAIVAGVKNAATYAANLDVASRQLHLNIEALDLWGNAVQRTGGTVESFQAAIGALATHLGTSAANALRLLPQLADAFHRMGNQPALIYGHMLGLDTPTILLLQQGRREVDALLQRQKYLGVVTKQDQEIYKNFRNELADSGHAWRSTFMILGETVIPLLTRLLEIFIKIAVYLRGHSDLMVGALIAIGAAAVVAFAPFVAANIVVIGVTAAVIALGAAFALVYEDIVGFFKGYDSLLGDLLAKVPTTKKAFLDFTLSILEAFNPILKVLGFIVEHIDKIKSFLHVGGTSLGLDIQNGQGALAVATNNPIASQTSNSIFNSRSATNAPNITIGDIIVNTNATDADGTAQAIQKHLRDQTWQIQNNAADGRIA